MTYPSEKLVDELEAELTRFELADVPAAGEFTEHMCKLAGSALKAIVYYGSTLNPGMGKKSSTPDYYVIVEDYPQYYRNVGKTAWLHSTLNRFCPPSIYRFGASKFSVISLADLQRETSAQARDVYNMGRFSKRVAIAWASDAKTQREVAECSAKAMANALEKSLPLVPAHFELDDIIQKTLQLSYLGEPRVEAQDKLTRIFASQTELYRRLYGALIKELADSVTWLEIKEGSNNHLLGSSHAAKTERFISRSRRRAVYRWPKFLVTVESWPDYMIEKIERTHGMKITLTDRERRYPVVYCWKYIWMLWRSKMLK